MKLKEIEVKPILIENVPEDKQGKIKHLVKEIMKNFPNSKVIRKVYDKNRKEYFIEFIIQDDDFNEILKKLREGIKSIF